MQSSRGFTLVELMVTIAVMGIIAAIAAPSFSKLNASRQLDSANKIMAASLNEAKSRAAAMRAPVIVCTNKKNDNSVITKKLCVDMTISGADANLYTDQNRVLIVDIPKKVSVQSSSALNIMFMPTGIPSEVKVFEFCSSGETRKIKVSVLGIMTQDKGIC